MSKLIVVFLGMLIFSCARINQAEQDNYKAENKIRHGIVPISHTENTKKSKVDDKSLARGKEIYQKHCLQCHGEKGLGDGPMSAKMHPKPVNLKNTVKEVSHFNFYLSISEYVGRMPGWQHPLNEKEREDVANYIKTFAEN